jgi:RND family efflux transporter MFP subunit
MTTRTIGNGALAALLAASWGCSGRRAEEKPARPVRVEAVAAAAAPAGLRYSATIQPYDQVALAFKVSGYVRDLRRLPGTDGRPRALQAGDAVGRGTVLARIEPADYQARVDQAAAQQAEATAALVRARADGARAESLYQAKALTRPDYDASRASLQAAEARVAAASAALRSARIALGDASLVAPADGVVLSRSVEVGALAGAGTVAFAMADLTRVKAVFGVPDRVIERVRAGARLALTTDAFPGASFPGSVTAVSPAADLETRVFDVEVTIPNADRRLKAGMIATVEVDPGEASAIAPGVATVPVAAVVKSKQPGGYAVFVAEGASATTIARPRDVALGPVAGNRVAVLSGVAIGERVVVSGASLLNAGDRLQVIPGEGR